MQEQNIQNVEERVPTQGSNESQEALEEHSPSKVQKSSFKPNIDYLEPLLKSSFKDIATFAVCIVLGWVIASKFVQRNDSEISTGILASSEILLNKKIRGIYPPLSGDVQAIYFKWELDLLTAVNEARDLHRNYSLFFKRNGELEVFSRECNGKLRMHWKSFYHNIYIKQIEAEEDRQDMSIPNEQEDEKCIRGRGGFIQVLSYVSIWTTHGEHLYLISQVPGSSTMSEYMLILTKAIIL